MGMLGIHAIKGISKQFGKGPRNQLFASERLTLSSTN